MGHVSTAGDERTIGAMASDAGLLSQQLQDVAANVGSVLYGKRDVVRLTLACLAAGGHLLIEDLPGVGKTTLAKALAQTLGLHCRRVQFTADLLPSDLIGAMVLDRERMTPVFHPGPVFTNILLADELNRASPKAQSALLEAMEEGQVSVDGVTHPLPKPFMVIATQNPYDSSGTYPLPFSQRDRFLLRTSIGYPGRKAEDRLLANSGARPRPEDLRVIGGAPMLASLARAVDTIFVAPEVRAYVLDLVEATRNHPSLLFGASPRAGLALLRTASGYAITAGRDYLMPDDVKAVAGVVLGHRLAVTSAAELGGYSSSALVAELLTRVPVPVRVPVTAG
jgi:MoxR-like ATPase